MLPATCSWPGNLSVLDLYTKDRRKLWRLPSYAVYLGYHCWLEKGIRDATEGGADVDGDDEGTSMALVGFAGICRGPWRRHRGIKGRRKSRGDVF